MAEPVDVSQKIQLHLFGQGSHSAVPFDRYQLMRILDSMREGETLRLGVEQDAERHGEWKFTAEVYGGPRDRQVLGRTGQ